MNSDDDRLDALTSNPSGIGQWREWAVYVLKMLSSLNNRCDILQRRMEDDKYSSSAQSVGEHSNIKALIDDVRRDVESLRIEVAVLKVKAGLWGAVGAAIPVIVGGLLFVLQRR